ncbi:hypothetical protein EK21DRAFT_109688 [Setomelanomma holmii]|uniref:Uncharacterized protein n=1 Tax=Setomelanomma holmii TaxID=210430 RepID=A0A9P4HGJ3_9PLEO|nr:hypothetical protein EK21DRAFT_109688 [Setomelanomma holmii]
MSLSEVELYARQHFPAAFATFPIVATFAFTRFEPSNLKISYVEGLHLGTLRLVGAVRTFDLEIVSWAPSSAGFRAAIVLDGKGFQSRPLLNLLQQHQVSLVEPFASIFASSSSVQPAFAKLAVAITYTWLWNGDMNGTWVWFETGYCYTFLEALERACQAIKPTSPKIAQESETCHAKQPTALSGIVTNPVAFRTEILCHYPDTQSIEMAKSGSRGLPQEPSKKKEAETLRHRVAEAERKAEAIQKQHVNAVSKLKQEHVRAIEDLERQRAQTVSILKARKKELSQLEEHDNNSETSTEYVSAQEEAIDVEAKNINVLAKDGRYEDEEKEPYADTQANEMASNLSIHNRVMILEESLADIRQHMYSLKRDIVKGNCVNQDLSSRIDNINTEIYNLKINDTLDNEQRAKLESTARVLWEGGRLEHRP